MIRKLLFCVCMQSKTHTVITKANGEREQFDPEKLHRSLVRSGASRSVADTITSKIESSLRDGDKTQEIYRRAFKQLRRVQAPIAARYSVKRALLDLGPSGYPFEDFIAEIYRKLGYEAQTRAVVQGRCIEHELDIVAKKGEERLGAEIKFHNNPGIKSDIKVALYVNARFDDIASQSGKGSDVDFTNRLLITNTKFTQQVEIYAACVGLQLVSWDYPVKGNLRELIEETGLHPVSCLTTLSNVHKKKLMEQGIVLCRQVRERAEDVEVLGLSKKTMSNLFEEINNLCEA